MDQSALRKLLEEVREGRLSPDEALMRLRHLPFEDLGFLGVFGRLAITVRIYHAAQAACYKGPALGN